MEILILIAACAVLVALGALAVSAAALRRAAKAPRSAPTEVETLVERRQARHPDTWPRPLGRGEFVSAFKAAKAMAPGAVLVIDADEFSTMKQKFGEAASREALQLIEEAIRSAIRSADLLGRIEDHKFVVFLQGADPSLSRQIGARICETVEDTIFMTETGRIAPLSVSVGGVPTRQDDGLEEIRMANDNLAQSQAEGPGRVRVVAG